MAFNPVGPEFCRHCKMERLEHAVEEKCLFDSTHFELMSEEEYEREFGDPNAEHLRDWENDQLEGIDDFEPPDPDPEDQEELCPSSANTSVNGPRLKP